jgi:hypothetical protein
VIVLLSDDAAQIKTSVAPLDRDALLSHDRRDQFRRRNVKTGIIDPVQSFGSDQDGRLSPVTLGIEGRGIQSAAHDARLQRRTMLDGNAFYMRFGMMQKLTDEAHTYPEPFATSRSTVVTGATTMKGML